MNRAQHIGLGNEAGTFSEVIHGLRFSLTQGLLVIADSVTIIDLVVVGSLDRLSWSNHTSELCRKISSAIGAPRRIRPLISQSTAVQIYNALIQPHFDYCAPVWDGLSSYLCEKLQKLENRAARVILQANCEVNSSLLLETLKWDQLSLRRRKQKAMMMFKSLNGLAPVYLHALFSERDTDYDLRDSFRKLNLPKPRTNYLKRSFSYKRCLTVEFSS